MSNRVIGTPHLIAAVAMLGVVGVQGARGSSVPLSPTAVASGARLSVEQGIELVTIGRPGNAAYDGRHWSSPPPLGAGRGRVDYEYRIGRMEVTTACT